MIRDLKKLARSEFDVLIIGGGISGAAIAYQAARAGYHVAIVDKNDFGHATSANSLKILHGGLRYLQHLNFPRMRHSISARREIMAFAPHLVRPLACLMPTYGHGLRGKEVMRCALLLNDIISLDRNRGLPPHLHLPAGYTISKKDFQNLLPGISLQNLTGGSVWHDALAVNTERLVLEFLHAASNHGAIAANYLEVRNIEKKSKFHFEVKVNDSLTDRSSTLQAKIIINASGPWLQTLYDRSGIADGTEQHWALALNLIVKKQLTSQYAIGIEGSKDYQDQDAFLNRGKRLYFLVPFQGHTMIGTDYVRSKADPGHLSVTAQQINKILCDFNAIYHSAALCYEDVTFFHVGLLPLASNPENQSQSLQLEKNSQIIDHNQDGLDGVISIKGVKYTTAPQVAQEVLKRIKRKIHPNDKHPPSKDFAKKGVTAPEQHVPENFSHLRKQYGSRAGAIYRYYHDTGEQLQPRGLEGSLSEAEIRYFIEQEMACTLADIVFRRSDLGAVCHPGIPRLRRIAESMARILNWNSQRMRQELEVVRQRYAPLSIAE